jgi:predicted nucleic acid-binding Zn ribbon protein
MTTYVYETIPQRPGEAPVYFEVKQSLVEAPLKVHPETGQPVRRVVLAGLGVLKAAEPAKGANAGDCGCAPGSCCG